jgi:hypothetical protein
MDADLAQRTPLGGLKPCHPAEAEPQGALDFPSARMTTPTEQAYGDHS